MFNVYPSITGQMDASSRGFKLAQLALEKAKKKLTFSGAVNEKKNSLKNKRKPLRELYSPGSKFTKMKSVPSNDITPDVQEMTKKPPLKGIRRLTFKTAGEKAYFLGSQ